MAEAEQYDTTDRSIILLLLTAGLPITSTSVDDRNKTKFHFDRVQATAWIDKLHRNESIKFEFSDFIKALGLFNGIVHSR